MAEKKPKKPAIAKILHVEPVEVVYASSYGDVHIVESKSVEPVLVTEKAPPPRSHLFGKHRGKKW